MEGRRFRSWDGWNPMSNSNYQLAQDVAPPPYVWGSGGPCSPKPGSERRASLCQTMVVGGISQPSSMLHCIQVTLNGLEETQEHPRTNAAKNLCTHVRCHPMGFSQPDFPLSSQRIPQSQRGLDRRADFRTGVVGAGPGI